MPVQDDLSRSLADALREQDRTEAALDDACRRHVHLVTVDFTVDSFDRDEFQHSAESVLAAHKRALDGAANVKRLSRLVRGA